MFSLRIVNVDHYLSTPIPGFDVTYSEFRGCHVKQVPVVRVFGATPAGQKTCLHLHGVFPYICVPADVSTSSTECEKVLHQVAVSIDRALNISLGKANSVDAQHVYKVSLVSGIPFYGYHSREQHFYKIYFYNPLMVKRVVELLQNGAVLNKAFQPHEAHVPFILQMFIDYNLYGMNLLNLASVKFRRQKKDDFNLERNNDAWTETSTDFINSSSESNANSSSSNQNSYSDVKYRKWTYALIPDGLFLPEEVERQSVCELEVDALASDILNRMELISNPGMNPGLKAIWEDEKLRRQKNEKGSQITPSNSQDRGVMSLQATELRYLEKLKCKINQSEQKIQVNDSPLDLSYNLQNVCIPSRVQEMHTPSGDDQRRNVASNFIETEPVVNEDLVLSLSQSLNTSQQGSSILDTQDEELIDALTKMCSSQALADGDSILSTENNVWDQNNLQIDEYNEENETKEMSQLIWDSHPDVSTDTLPQVDGPLDPKQTNSGSNRTQRLGRPVSATQLSATAGMRFKTARKSTYGGMGALHPIPGPVTNHQYRGAPWAAQPMQSVPPVPQNFLFQNHQHPGPPMHWTNYRDYNMWPPMDMTPSPGFPPNPGVINEPKKPAPCWPNTHSSGQANCREFSAMNPFSDGYPAIPPYNPQERLPTLNMPNCLSTPPGGFYEPHSFIPPLNYNCDMAMSKECVKYQQQQQQQQQQQHQQQQSQQFMSAGNAFNCMESMNGNQKNFISLQRISYQVSWPDDNNRNEPEPNYYPNPPNANATPTEIASPRTTCGDVLAAAMSSSGIDMHSLTEVCEEEEQSVEFVERPPGASSACRVEESSVMASIMVGEREQCVSAVTRRCKTSVVTCIPGSGTTYEEGTNPNWIEESPVWLVDVKPGEGDIEEVVGPEGNKPAEQNELMTKSEGVQTSPKEQEKTLGIEGVDAVKVGGNETTDERTRERVKKPNKNIAYVLPDLSSIIESEELFDGNGMSLDEDEGTGTDFKGDGEDSDRTEKLDESPNLQLSDISDDDHKDGEDVSIDQIENDVRADVELSNDERTEEVEDGARNDEEELVDHEEVEEVILIELNENEQLMVVDVSEETKCCEEIVTDEAEEDKYLADVVNKDVDLREEIINTEETVIDENVSEDQLKTDVNLTDGGDLTGFSTPEIDGKKVSRIEGTREEMRGEISEQVTTNDLDKNGDNSKAKVEVRCQVDIDGKYRTCDSRGEVSCDKSIPLMSTTCKTKPRTPVLEKMAFLVRKALSSLHDRELMTDLTIGSIDSGACMKASTSANDFVPSASEQPTKLSLEKRGEGTSKKSVLSSQSNGSLAGKGDMKKRKKKLDNSKSPGNGKVRTRTVGTNVHPQDLPRRRSGHLYLVRYHGLRVTVDEKGLEDLKKLGKERVCVRKLKTDVSKKVSECVERKKRFPTKKWTLQRNGDVSEGLKMRFKADRNAVSGDKQVVETKKDLGIAQGRERRLKVDYKPHAFSHIFKFDVMPDRDVHRKKSVKLENKGVKFEIDKRVDERFAKSQSSLKLLLKKRVQRKAIQEGKKSFDWSISQMDTLLQKQSNIRKRKPKSAKAKSQLTFVVTPGIRDKPMVKEDGPKAIKSSVPIKIVDRNEDKFTNDEIISKIPTPPRCWSPNESKVYQELRPLEVDNAPIEENGNLDGWVPFNFTLENETLDQFDKLKSTQVTPVQVPENDVVNNCEEECNDKTVLLHRNPDISEDCDLFCDSSLDAVHVYESDNSRRTSESQHKNVGVAIDLSDDDGCPLSEDEKEAKTNDDEALSEDGNIEDSLMLSDLTDDEDSETLSETLTLTDKSKDETANLSNPSQDLFPLSLMDISEDVKESEESRHSDKSNSVHSDDLFVISDEAISHAMCEGRNEQGPSTPDTEQEESLTLVANKLDYEPVSDASSDYEEALVIDDKFKSPSPLEEPRASSSRLESLPNSTPEDKTFDIQSFYSNETPETSRFSITQKSEVPRTKSEKIYTWYCKPPSRKEVEDSLNENGLPVYRHSEAHFSRPEDGQLGNPVENHKSKFSNQGLVNWRSVLCARSSVGDSYRDIFKELKNNNPRMTAALLSNRRIIITPNQIPPGRKAVEDWVRGNERERDAEEHEKTLTADSKVQTPSMTNIKPKHSTPHSAAHMLPSFSPSWTPILKKRRWSETDEESNGSCKKMRTLEKIGEDKLDKAVRDEENIANHPKKKYHRDSKWRKHALQLSGKVPALNSKGPKQCLNTTNSQLSGPSLENSHGFKTSCGNLHDAKTLHEYQYLTVFSLELHVRTRRNLRPDPHFDPIRAVFYSIYNDVPEKQTVRQDIIGCIAVNEHWSDKSNNCKHGSSASKTSECPQCRKLKRHLAVHTGIMNIKTSFVGSEAKLFDEIVKLVRMSDPDILVGYEIETLSWGFLLKRASFLKLDLHASLSRIPKVKTEAIQMDEDGEDLQLKGRIVLNMWRLMRREVTLTSYRFENVAYHILHQRIPLYSFKNLTDWFDDQSDLSRWRTYEHYVTRCHCNIKLLLQVDFIGRTSELARLFGIQFYEVLSRGSQFRVESMMLRLAKLRNYVSVSPSIQQRAKMRAPQCLPLILEPESKFYSNPVLVLDFQSLYPSMIIAYNYCYSTCLGHADALGESNAFKFGCTELVVPPGEMKAYLNKSHLNISPTGNVFVKSNIRKGVIPQMLEEILDTRIMVKKAMKEYKNDKSVCKVLDARQLGLKLIANVTYGYTAANYSGRMPCSEVADSVVGKARETLERAISMVNENKKWNAHVVYGDTDSLFVHLPGRSKKDAFRIGQEIADAVTAANPKPVKLKFEKVYLPCVLETKKRYVGFMYETPEQTEPVFDAKGIETVRRDGCPAVVKVLEKSLRILFTTRDVSRVKSYVQRQFQKLFAGRVSLQDVTLAREYRGRNGYKPNACVPALELAKRMRQEDPQAEPLAGDRVPYVVVYGSPGAPLFHLVRRPDEVLLDKNLRINAHYYVNNLLVPSLQRVFGLLEVDVSQWYTTMSRLTSHRFISGADTWYSNKKGTISHYFSPMSCPVCGDTGSKDLCSKCRSDPQAVVVTLNSEIRKLERNYNNLTSICASCTGIREKMSCISLDCPIFYRLAQASKDFSHISYLRKNIELLLDF